MKEVDFVVVGGGLSGSMIAYLLKSKKNDVVLLEKKDINTKEKLCGGLITKKTIDLLYTIFPKNEVGSLLISRFCKASTISDGNSILVDKIDIATVKRRELDYYVLDKYIKIGGIIFDKINIKEIDFDNNIIEYNEEKIKYKYLIAADGVLSQVRYLRYKKHQRRNFALETFVEQKSSYPIIEFDNKLSGYNWIIPCGNTVCYGTGGDFKKDDVKFVYQSFIEKNNIDAKNSKGAFLPTGDDILLQDENIFFVGDAAGLISPITGEGIYYAIKSSYILFNCILNSLDYFKMMNGDIHSIKKQLKLRKIIYNNKIRNYIFKKSQNNKLLLKACKKVCKKYVLCD